MKLASYLLRLPAILLALPLGASAAIYKWTDEHGTTVLSDRPPAAAAKVSSVQVVVEDDDPAVAPKPAAAPRPDNGNALQERVRALESQGLITRKGDRLATTPSGRLVLNRLILELAV